MEIKNYLIKIHGEKCFGGFIKTYVNCPAEDLTPSKVIKQNELIHSMANMNKLIENPLWYDFT